MLKNTKVAATSVPDHKGDCGTGTTSHDALQSTEATTLHRDSSGFLQTPEELQRQFVGQEHGGAHGKPSDGVDRRSAEENLHDRIKTLQSLETQQFERCHEKAPLVSDWG